MMFFGFLTSNAEGSCNNVEGLCNNIESLCNNVEDFEMNTNMLKSPLFNKKIKFLSSSCKIATTDSGSFKLPANHVLPLVLANGIFFRHSFHKLRL